MTKLDQFNKLFEGFNYPDKTKTKEENKAIAKAAVVAALERNGYSIDSYDEGDQEVFSIYNEKGVPVYIDHSKLEVEDFIKGALRENKIAYGSPEDEHEALRLEVAALREQTRDKRADKFMARINELQSLPGTPLPTVPEAYAKAIRERNEAIIKEEEARKERLQQHNAKTYERNFPLEEKKPEPVFKTDKFKSHVESKINQ